MTKTSVKGVQYKSDCKTNPYWFQIMKHGISKKHWHPTLEAAAAAKRAIAAAKVQAAEAERAKVKASEKYQQNQARNGNNSKQERDFVHEYDTQVRATYEDPESFLVMNDSTRADALVKRAKDTYLQVQAKTASTTVEGTNGYQFGNVLEYAGMLVVFWAVDKKRAWVFDGTWLHNNGAVQYHLTPGCETERPALQKNLTLTELIAYLHEADLAPHLQLTTEDAARRDFKSEDHKKEKIGIEGHEELEPGTYEWPREQNGVYDRVRVEEGRRTRIQHKSCGPLGQNAGLYCSVLGKCDGRDSGKQLHTCYAKDDADEYVFHYYDKKTSHYWKIPAQALADHGYFTKTTKTETISLYGPEGVGKQPNPNARNQADTWTRAYYIGSLQREEGWWGDEDEDISDDEDPVFFDLDMAGDDEDIPVEEVFYNAGDDAYLDDANDIG